MAKNANPEIEYKIVVMGGGGVGKSALTIRLISGNFLDEYDPTIEDSYRKTCQIDGEPALLDILDTAGQDEFAAMRDLWIREAKGFLLVYSITWSSTLEQAKGLYSQILKIKEDDLTDIAIVLCGNKCDLADNRTVPTADGIATVEEWKKEGIGAAFYETSAKAQINNEECFYEVVRQLRKKENETSETAGSSGGGSKCTCLLL